jgi:hypothetical protein
MHNQLWGYKVEWKSVCRGTGGKKVEYHWSSPYPIGHCTNWATPFHSLQGSWGKTRTFHTHLHLVPRSRMRGFIHQLPQYASMAWCSVSGTTLTFTFHLTLLGRYTYGTNMSLCMFIVLTFPEPADMLVKPMSIPFIFLPPVIPIIHRQFKLLSWKWHAT